MTQASAAGPKHAGMSDWFGLPQRTQRDTEIKLLLSVDPFHWLITGPDRCLFFASWCRGAFALRTGDPGKALMTR